MPSGLRDGRSRATASRRLNSADDHVNPPELGLVERLMPRAKKGRYILLPITDQIRGHGTHSAPAIWKGYVADFLEQLPQ